jgi:transposase
MILDLHRQGLTIAAIARETGQDRKTVRKYIARGLVAPVYGPREPRPTVLDPYKAYVRERLMAYPGLSSRRLHREIRDRGYTGCYAQVTAFVRELQPADPTGFERRFETPPGHQAQVDFAFFKTVFTDEPSQERIVWLFSMVLGHSRKLCGQFVLHQDLQTLLRCHVAAFNELGGVPQEILYDQMKTAVQSDQSAETGIVYNTTLLAFAEHYGFLPKACRPYRAKTKGKVERPFRYVRQDFFLARTFRNLEDLNAQYRQWLAEVANARRHATTDRVVDEHFAEEAQSLGALPAGPYTAVLKLDRRVTKDGMVSVGGNKYSVPDGTRRRTVEVHSLTEEIRILEGGRLIASHPVLEGRGGRRVAEGHRTGPPPGNSRVRREPIVVPLQRAGDTAPRRDLAVYDAIGRALALSEVPS